MKRNFKIKSGICLLAAGIIYIALSVLMLCFEIVNDNTHRYTQVIIFFNSVAAGITLFSVGLAVLFYYGGNKNSEIASEILKDSLIKELKKGKEEMKILREEAARNHNELVSCIRDQSDSLSTQLINQSKEIIELKKSISILGHTRKS